jgi:hypothetical protein
LEANAQLGAIALDNDPAPGTPGDYSFLGLPSLNDGRDVAFVSTLSGGGPVVGVFVESPSGSQAIALRGDPAPGAGGATFLNFGGVTVNASGDVAFQSTLSGGTIGSGLFVWSGGTISAVVLAGDPAPGTGGGTINVPSLPGFNDQGTITFASLINGGLVAEGIFRVSAGLVSPVALTGDAVPGVPGAFFSDFQGPGIGASGQIAFFARYFFNSQNGIFVDDGGVLSPVALVGDAAPGTGGSSYTQLSTLTPSVSPLGTVLFSSGFAGGAASGVGLFRAAGGAHTPIAFTGDAVPDVPGSTFVSFPDIGAINAAGDVAFQASISQPAGGRGVFLSESGILSTVAITGDPVPVSGGTFNSFGNRPAINTSGDVAFSAQANFGAASSGIWFLPEPSGALPLGLGAAWLFGLRRRTKTPSRFSAVTGLSGSFTELLQPPGRSIR